MRRIIKRAFGQRRYTHNGLRQLLKRFSDLLESYNERPKKEIAYWYGERSLTGLLAAAAWLLGNDGWSLEEFKTERRTEHKKSARGRCDLWLGVEGGRAGQFTVEAKLWEPERFSDPDDVVRGIKRKINSAFKQLSRLKKTYHWGRAAAVCFVTPCLPLPVARSCVRENQITFKRVLKKLNADEQTVAAAFWYQSSSILPRYKETKKGYYSYPGLIVVINYRSRWPVRSFGK